MDTEDQEFDAAWDEATSGSPAAAQQQEPKAAEEPAAIEEADKAAEQAAEEPKQDEAAPAEPLNTAPETDPTDEAIWAGASEAQLTAFKAVIQQRDELHHQRKSDAGRVASYQRKATELERKIGALPTSADREDIDAYLKSEGYAKAKTEFGDDFGTVFTIIEALAKNTASIQEGQAQLADIERAEVARDVEGWLTEAAPDMVELFSNPGYDSWLKGQPKFVRDLHDRNFAQMVDPAEVVELCDRFRSHLGQPAPTAAAEPAPQVETPQKNDFDRNRRDVQLQGSKSVTSRAPIVAPPDANDEDAAWDEAVAAAERRAVAR